MARRGNSSRPGKNKFLSFNVRVMGIEPREEVSLFRASSDVQMIVLRRGKTSHSVPRKVYEIMASERSFVAAVDEGSPIWQPAKEDQGGLAIAPESAEQIAAAVRRLYMDRSLAADMARRGRQGVEAQDSVQAVGGRYDAIFRRLTYRKVAG